MPIRDHVFADSIIRRPIEVPPSCPLGESAALMAREGVSAVLVSERGRPVGLITERIVVGAVGAGLPADTPVSALMAPPGPAIAAGASSEEAAARLLASDAGWLGVTDRAGRYIGLLDARDLLRANAPAARRRADQRSHPMPDVDREQVAERLRQSEARYRQVVDSIGEVIFETDAQGRWLSLNRAWEAITGFPVADTLGQCWFDYVHPEDRQSALELFAALIARRRDPSRSEVRHLHGDGGFRWFEVFIRPTLGESDAVLGATGILADITARKVAETATERALAETRRLVQVRNDFLANMSHEIRTPLNVILGLAQAARQRRCEPLARRYFEQIEDAGRLLLAVVNDILDFSKIEAGRLALARAPFDLGRVIDQVLTLVAPQAYGKGLALVLDEPADLPPIWSGDGFRLSQVLLNLLGNAVKFTERGEVTLAVRRAREPNESAGIVFRVEDTGVGMTAEQLERLFQPFQQADSSTTRQFGGTGLGLAICKRLVDMMAGRLDADSRPGRGSAFDLRIPLSPAAETVKPTAAWRSVALVGLTATEARSLSVALRERGLDASELPAAEIGAADGFDLILLDSALLAERAAVVAIGAALDRGRRAAVVLTPGLDPNVPGILDGRVSLVERPLSARRLLAAESLRPNAAPSSAEARRLKGLRILAAEDNPVNQMVLEQLLTREGAEVILADHGVQALERLCERGAGYFDLVLTDIQMPEMDGYETARRIRALAPGLPVIGLTAHAMPEERKRCLAAGMCDHLAKPIDLEVLVAAIGRHAATAPDPAMATGVEPAARPPSDPGPVAGIDADPIIDWVAVDRYFEGNRELIDELIVLTLQTQSEVADQLRQAAAEPDWEGIARLAHGLKSLCGYFQARPMLDLAKRAEQSARQQQPDAPQLARALAAAMDELLAALAERRRETAPAKPPESITDAEFAARLREFAEALRSRRMDACRLAESLQGGLPDDLRRPALEAAIREARRLEFGAALVHLEPVLASGGDGGP